jgi:hypothetical protein
MALLYPTQDVRYARVGDALVLLDLKSEQYIAFDPIATRMWQGLTAGGDADFVVAELQRSSGGDSATIASDFAAFRKRCVDSGYLQSEPIARQEGAIVLPVRRVAVHRAWWTLMRTVRRLRTLGFSKTYRLYGRLAKPAASHAVSSHAARQDEALLDNAIAVFGKAENFVRLPNAPKDCLPRSLALYRFLLLSGLAPAHLIGVQRQPFEAHAWVECGDRIVCDTKERVEHYSVIARL